MLSTSTVPSTRPPVFSFSLWQVTQYRLTTPRCGETDAAAAVAGCCCGCATCSARSMLEGICADGVRGAVGCGPLARSESTTTNRANRQAIVQATRLQGDEPLAPFIPAPSPIVNPLGLMMLVYRSQFCQRNSRARWTEPGLCTVWRENHTSLNPSTVPWDCSSRRVRVPESTRTFKIVYQRTCSDSLGMRATMTPDSPARLEVLPGSRYAGVPYVTERYVTSVSTLSTLNTSNRGSKLTPPTLKVFLTPRSS